MDLSQSSLQEVLDAARACTVCAEHLPLGPRPVVRATETARLLIIGQAPGTKVHETGIPWNDPSGERLRDWLKLDPDQFYDESLVAIVPTGFCYPGRLPKGGDAPPRPECAPLWHQPILSRLRNVQLTLLVGSYAQKVHLGPRRKRTMTETIRTWQEFAPSVIPLPHPSWRTLNWAKKNPWFEAEVLPVLRRKVDQLMSAE